MLWAVSKGRVQESRASDNDSNRTDVYPHFPATGAPVTACVTGSQAIGDAARMIKAGEAGIAICGGGESTNFQYIDFLVSHFPIYTIILISYMKINHKDPDLLFFGNYSAIFNRPYKIWLPC